MLKQTLAISALFFAASLANAAPITMQATLQSVNYTSIGGAHVGLSGDLTHQLTLDSASFCNGCIVNATLEQDAFSQDLTPYFGTALNNNGGSYAMAFTASGAADLPASLSSAGTTSGGSVSCTDYAGWGYCGAFRSSLTFSSGSLIFSQADLTTPGAFSGTLILRDPASNNQATYTYALSGTIEPSAVPIPAAAWLFGSAMLGLGLLKRRQG